jgi:hypothetical protein
MNPGGDPFFRVGGDALTPFFVSLLLCRASARVPRPSGLIASDRMPRKSSGERFCFRGALTGDESVLSRKTRRR